MDPVTRDEMFGRAWRVRVGVVPKQTETTGMTTLSGWDVSGLDIEAEVEKDLTGEPNKCTLRVYNLPENARAALEQANIYDPKKAPKGTTTQSVGVTPESTKVRASSKQVKSGRIRVEIEAGYKDRELALIFRGDIRRALSKQEDDKTWVTSIEGEDAGRSLTSSRITESFPAGTSKLTVVKKCLEALGLGAGNLMQVEAQLAKQTYLRGTVLDGQASKELAGVVKSAGLTYSVQDGAVQFLVVGQGLRRTAVRLNASTGLIGYPERDTTGLLKVESLLNPDLFVGNYVLLESPTHQGSYIIQKVTYSLSTFSQNWYARLELKDA